MRSIHVSNLTILGLAIAAVLSPALAPFAPRPLLVKEKGALKLAEHDGDAGDAKPFGRLTAFHGQMGMFVRALAYMMSHGGDGLRQVADDAVLNANYIAHHLKNDYEIAISGKAMHEVIFNDKRQQKFGVHTLDIAKRLIDYGFHPMTIYFPLVVPGAMMIEPTESEGRDELDIFIDAMKSIARESEENPELVKSAPHNTRIGRLDEAAAARKPVLRWKPVAAAAGQK